MELAGGSDALSTRNLVAHIASLSDDVVCLVLNFHGSSAEPPDWLPEIIPNVRAPEVPFDLIAPKSQHAVFVAFAASRRMRHVVSAARLQEDPEQLRQLHMVALDGEAGQEAHTIVLSFPDDEAVEFEDLTDVEPVVQRRIEYRCNEVGAMLTFDPALETLLGWTAADLLGGVMLNIIHPDDAQESIDRWLTVVTTKNPVHGRVRQRTKAGEWKWFEVTNTNLIDSEGYIRCELLDITAEMEMLDELTKQEELLRQLTDALPSGVVHFDRAGRLLFANDRLAEITGVLHGQLDDYLELFDPSTQDDIQEMAYRIYADAIEVDLEAPLYRRDGEVRHTRLAFRPLLVDYKGAGGLLICVDDITESWTLRNELAKQATTDGLTGVANRSTAHEALAKAMADRRSSGTGVVYFDLNGFKTANDEHGHAYGDAMLVTLSERLTTSARDSDTVGRVGGDEFIVVAPDTDETQLAALSKRLLDAVNAPSEDFDLDAACGFTLVEAPAAFGTPDHVLEANGAAEAERAISEADVAMYVHKRNPAPWPVQFHPSFLLPGDAQLHRVVADEREAS